jgi:hypothetical protein
MLKKMKVIKTIGQLPDEFTLDELIEQMVFLEEVEKSLAQSAEEQYYAGDDSDPTITHWFG